MSILFDKYNYFMSILLDRNKFNSFKLMLDRSEFVLQLAGIPVNSEQCAVPGSEEEEKGDVKKAPALPELSIILYKISLVY